MMTKKGNRIRVALQITGIALPLLLLAGSGCWDPSTVALSADGGGDGDADGDTDGDTDSDVDTDGPPSITSISASPSCAEVGTALTFSAQVTGAITAYAWDFGDGVVSTEAQPAHFYANPGYYNIELTVTGPEGEDILAEPQMVRVINQGWTRMHPPTAIGKIREIWQDADSPTAAVAVGDKGFMRWNGTSWTGVPVPQIQRFNFVASHESWGGTSALILGEDEDNFPVVVFDESSDVADADPTGLLPKEQYTTYFQAVMDWWDTGYMAVVPDGANIEIWRFDNNVTPPWSLLPATGAPNWISDFALSPITWNQNAFFLLQASALYRGEYDKSAPASFPWQSFYPPGSPYYTTMAANDTGNVLLGGYDGILTRGIWNGATSTFTFENIDAAGLWTTAYDFEDIWIDGDGTSAVASATMQAPNEHTTTVIVHIANIFSDAPVGGSPVVTGIAHDGLSTGIEAQVAMSGTDHIWYGSNSGYMGLWNGSVWQAKTAASVSGYPGYTEVTRDAALLTVVGGDPGVLMDLSFVTPEITELPTGAMSISAWQAAPDDIWLFGFGGEAYHYDGTDFTSEDMTGVLSDGFIFKSWSSSPNDIWSVGGGSSGAAILHYNGAGWIRDAEAERALGGEMAGGIGGTGPDDIYISGSIGLIIHWDGVSWAKLQQNVFSEPADFGVCLTAPPSGCAGNGSGFSAMHLNVTEDGTLFAGILDGTYAVLADAEAGCDIGEYRCILQPTAEEFMSTSVSRFSNDTWSLIPLSDPGTDSMAFLYGLWGASAERLYANQITLNTLDDSFTWSVLTWDGTTWTALDDQPTLADLFIFLDGATAGDVWGYGFEGMESVMRYQTCDH